MAYSKLASCQGGFYPKSLKAIILFIFLVLGRPDELAAQEPVQVESLPGRQVILRLDERVNLFHVPPPEQAELGIQSASFSINWNPGSCSGSLSVWPDEAKTAFNYAVGIWASLLNSTQTIEIDACWRSDLGPGVLGSAGPTAYYRNFPGAPVVDTWYPIALANALSGSDRNFGTAEIETNLSSTFEWYYGTDGNTPGDRLDFASVVLHELGHGLGFVGSMGVTGGQGSWGYLGSPDIYDRFTEDGSGNSLINTGVYPNPSATLGSALTGNNIYFDGSNANAANGGSRVKLHAPSTWSSGSSYAHLDEIFDNSVNALMTFALAYGESEHSPGPVTLGIFKDMGWSANSLDRPDLKITKQVVGTGHQPGDPVAFVLSIQNSGTVTATGVLVTDTLSTDILSPDWSSSLAGVSEQSGTYVWSLPDLAAGASGTITVTGVIRGTLPPDFAIVNSASLSTVDAESNTANNSSTAMVGGVRIYLPIVLKNN
ncbi:MAG: hypothetical protein AB1801_20670 [Chloroflexota bacterium]